MADNAANLSRCLAITQLIVGLMLFSLGIGELVVEVLVTHNLYIGISFGIWVSRTVKCYFVLKDLYAMY